MSYKVKWWERPFAYLLAILYIIVMAPMWRKFIAKLERKNCRAVTKIIS